MKNQNQNFENELSLEAQELLKDLDFNCRGRYADDFGIDDEWLNEFVEEYNF